jgi:hypothetical protein
LFASTETSNQCGLLVTLSAGTPPDRKPRIPLPIRRWVRFRLRTLLILTAAVAVLLSVLTVQTKTQRLAREIHSLHGEFYIEHRGPDWARKWFGRELEGDFFFERIGPFDRLSYVELGLCGGATSPPPTKVRDEWLKNLAGLHMLKELGLSGTRVTDEGVGHLTDLPNLRVLRIAYTPITDVSVAQISTFSQLEELHLEHTRTTDAGVAYLSMLRKLKTLRLEGTPITDRAAIYLRRMKSLEYLDLRQTAVSEGCVEDLRRALPNCYIFG